MNHEFQLIRQFFQHSKQHALTRLGNGDDASVHAIPEGYELVVSSDASVMGVHWPDDFCLQQAADRAVCAALSDLAAMGAEALWVWSTVFLSSSQQAEDMAAGIQAACQRYHIEIAGGDTVSAPYPALNLTVAGIVPQQQAMRRDQAKVGDDIWLLGHTGHAALGLEQWQQGQRETFFTHAFGQVVPKLAQGLLLRQMGVRCCIDVSDGLLQDAQHIADASAVQLQLHVECLDIEQLQQHLPDHAQTIALSLSGGEDYALLFCAPKTMRDALLALHGQRIGTCVLGAGVHVLEHGQRQFFDIKGYDHFAAVA